MGHLTSVIDFGDGFTGHCTCKARGPRVNVRSKAEDWGTTHLRQVERAKSHLRGRAPSLREQYTYYRIMQADPEVPEAERAQWKILADGLEHRLGLPHAEESMF